MSDQPLAEPSYVLRSDVEIIRRRTALLLFGRHDERTVRTSPVATLLLPLLREGADFEQLRLRLQAAQPAAVDIRPKLATFLAALVKAGLVLESSEQAEPPPARARRRRTFPLLDLNPAAAAATRPLAVIGVRAGIALAALLAVLALAAVATLAARGLLPRLPDQVEQLHWSGVVLFILIVVPVHEFAHAVACRLAGQQVGAFGIMLHGGIIPGPYVDTSQSYRITGRWRRFMIPAAGPFVNLIAAGTVAALLLLGGWSPTTVALLHGLLLFCLLFVFFDTNPFTASDGSHCLEALLEDELARRHALRRIAPQISDRGVVRRYRFAMLAHATIAAALFALWWG